MAAQKNIMALAETNLYISLGLKLRGKLLKVRKFDFETCKKKNYYY